MRLLRMLLGHQDDQATPGELPTPAAPPPVPAGVTNEDRLSLAQARQRLPAKWRAMDHLVAVAAAAYSEADGVLRKGL